MHKVFKKTGLTHPDPAAIWHIIDYSMYEYPHLWRLTPGINSTTNLKSSRWIGENTDV